MPEAAIARASGARANRALLAIEELHLIMIMSKEQLLGA
jgi:hypothetical protein